ncbi:MAG: hypothetical protein ACI8PZ_000485 [Myxococcota bacterium]|jgi:hypothetical protein
MPRYSNFLTGQIHGMMGPFQETPMRILALLPILAFATAANAQTLSMSGACPGPVAIDVTGLTPGGTAVFLAGTAGEGSDVIGVGACTGTVTGLAGLRFMTRVSDDDADGSLSFSPSIPDARCSTSIQVLDTATCTMSNVTSADAGGGGDPLCGHMEDVFVEDGALGYYCGGAELAHWKDYGLTTFEECECIANRTGTTWAVGASSPVVTIGWLGDHDDGVNATVSGASWPTEELRGRDTLEQCVLGTYDARGEYDEFPEEQTYTDADGRNWHYWVFSSQTNSQAAHFAQDVGGRVINPASVGDIGVASTTGLTHWCHAAAEFNGGGDCNGDAFCTQYVGYFE